MHIILLILLISFAPHVKSEEPADIDCDKKFNPVSDYASDYFKCVYGHIKVLESKISKLEENPNLTSNQDQVATANSDKLAREQRNKEIEILKLEVSRLNERLSHAGVSMVEKTCMPYSGTLRKICDSGEMIIGQRESYAPFLYYDGLRREVGYTHDLTIKVLDAVKAELKAPIRPVYRPVTDKDDVPSLLNQGVLDIDCGLNENTKQQSGIVNFSNNFYLSKRNSLLVKANSGIRRIEDLAGKKVATISNSKSDIELTHYKSRLGIKVRPLEYDRDKALEMLESGEADAYMMDEATLFSIWARTKNPNDWMITGESNKLDAYACILSKDDPDFKRLVDNVFASVMKVNGKEMYETWFESTIPPNVNFKYPMSNAMSQLFANPHDQPIE